MGEPVLRTRALGSRRRLGRWVLLLVLLGLGAYAGLSADGSEPVVRAQSKAPAPSEPRKAQAAKKKPDPKALLQGLEPRGGAADAAGVMWAPLAEGHRAELTLDAGLQGHMDRLFDQYEVPFGALVAMSPDTGELLAYVSHTEGVDGMSAPDLVRDATPPSASVFKLITASALVDAGVSGRTRVCYHGGAGRIDEGNLVDDPGRDTRCGTLAEAVGKSTNSIFAKLAVKHLDADKLERYAAAFGFGHALPFDVPTQASPAEVPSHTSEKLEFARTSAGFWHMHMSPLHGALIASTFANDGVMPRPTMVRSIANAEGTKVYEHQPEDFRHVIGRNTARAVGEMMVLTTTEGTAKKAFFDAQGRPFLPGISVAGKTGTLSSERPYRGYTWWVGFAPADNPKIAVAALVVNSPRWRIKASYAAREAMRYYLIEKPQNAATPAAQGPTTPTAGAEATPQSEVAAP